MSLWNRNAKHPNGAVKNKAGDSVLRAEIRGADNY